jgi:hypothetical protein
MGKSRPYAEVKAKLAARRATKAAAKPMRKVVSDLPAPKQRQPTVGRIVLLGRVVGEKIPAIITVLRGEMYVDLVVFGLGLGDYDPATVLTNVPHGDGPGQWSWPPVIP